MIEQLTIVLPCYNEQENIPRFFPELLPFAEEHHFKVIAVNDGSQDENVLSKVESLKVLFPQSTIFDTDKNVLYRPDSN